VNYDVASLLALAAAVRAFAPDVQYLLRRLLSAGVRVGAASLVEKHQRQIASPVRPVVPPLDEGGL
jgi:hypothetical protein